MKRIAIVFLGIVTAMVTTQSFCADAQQAAGKEVEIKFSIPNEAQRDAFKKIVQNEAYEAELIIQTEHYLLGLVTEPEPKKGILDNQNTLRVREASITPMPIKGKVIASARPHTELYITMKYRHLDPAGTTISRDELEVTGSEFLKVLSNMLVTQMLQNVSQKQAVVGQEKDLTQAKTTVARIFENLKINADDVLKAYQEVLVERAQPKKKKLGAMQLDVPETVLAVFKQLGYGKETLLRKTREAYTVYLDPANKQKPAEIAFDTTRTADDKELGKFVEIELKYIPDTVAHGELEIYKYLQKNEVDTVAQYDRGYVQMAWNPDKIQSFIKIKKLDDVIKTLETKIGIKK